MIHGGHEIQKDHVQIWMVEVVSSQRGQRFEGTDEIITQISDRTSIKRRQSFRFWDGRLGQCALESLEGGSCVSSCLIGSFDLIFLRATRQGEIRAATKE